MRSGFLIIAKVTFQNAAQMSVAEHDHVTETLAPDASNESLRERILPRASWSRPYFSNAHSLNSFLEIVAIDSVSITNQITRHLLLRKCFDHLLCRPSRRRMLGDIKVNHSPSFMRQNNKHKQHTQPGCRYREEVDRHEIADMVVQKGSPSLGGASAPFRHESGNGTFGNLDSQLEQFPMDSGCAPAQIGFSHRFYEFASIDMESSSACMLVLGQLGPVMFEALPVPVQNRFGPDHHQGGLPVLPDFPQTNPKQSIRWSDLCAANGSLEDSQLLAKRENFQSN